MFATFVDMCTIQPMETQMEESSREPLLKTSLKTGYALSAAHPRVTSPQWSSPFYELYML